MCAKSEKTSTDEIEITPAMIAAGANHLAHFDRDYDDEKDIVVKIYQAMLAAKNN